MKSYFYELKGFSDCIKKWKDFSATPLQNEKVFQTPFQNEKIF